MPTAIDPSGAEIRYEYRCEECGNLSDTHSSTHRGPNLMPACEECGAAALRKEYVETVSEAEEE